MTETFLDGRVTLHCGDNREIIRSIPDCSVDSIVTDPPYALVSIVKRFANSPRSEATENTENPYGRTGRGFMGQRWDTGDTVHAVEFWAQCLRVLKPGGHLISFAGTRTYHRMACAIEDAGFEIRDMLSWLYGSGFPKSHDVAKSIDKAERGVPHGGADPTSPNHGKFKGGTSDDNKTGQGFGAGPGQFMREGGVIGQRETNTGWEGWGTALKPACEPICMARKPLIGTVAENVLRHGTGAINVDGCRVGIREKPKVTDPKRTSNTYGSIDSAGGKLLPDARWPANIIHDGSDEVVEAFPDTASGGAPTAGDRNGVTYGEFAERSLTNHGANEGSAARFFYTAKADGDDRLGSKHPTVKPIDLMQWLVRLVTPKGGLVLDPFAGTGTTAEACFREGMRCTLVEREAAYQDDIRRRMRLVMAGPDERARESIKEKLKNQPVDAGPLFGTTG